MLCDVFPQFSSTADNWDAVVEWQLAALLSDDSSLDCDLAFLANQLCMNIHERLSAIVDYISNGLAYWWLYLLNLIKLNKIQQFVKVHVYIACS